MPPAAFTVLKCVMEKDFKLRNENVTNKKRNK
jgi:hypothetical protein